MDILLYFLFFCDLMGDIVNVLTFMIGNQHAASLANVFVKCFD